MENERKFEGFWDKAGPQIFVGIFMALIAIALFVTNGLMIPTILFGVLAVLFIRNGLQQKKG